MSKEDSMAEGTVESPSPPPRKKGGIKLFFVFIVVLALLMVILYLLSVMHSKKFYLVPEGNTLLVKKGIIFLCGSEIYKPNNPNQAPLYEAVEMPSEKLPLGIQEFEDLPSLNQAYATILIGLANDLVRSEDDRSFRKGKSLLERAKSLEGLNLKQVSEIDAHVTEIEYLEAKRTFTGIENILNEARGRFKKAETLGAGRFPDANDWVLKVDTLLDVIRANKNSPPPSSTPAEMPPTSQKQKPVTTPSTIHPAPPTPPPKSTATTP
jgi:hypothetical protein